MSQLEIFGYAPKALWHDPVGQSLCLHTAYTPQYGSVVFRPQEGTKGCCTAVDGRGALIRSGRMEREPIGGISRPDGPMIAMDRILVDGVLTAYVTSEPLEPGARYACDEGGGALERANWLAGDESGIGCFGPGTMITTEEGEIPVEWLETSDRVLTRDHGFQPILWIGRTKRSRIHFQQFPQECPVLIPAGSLSANTPTHDLNLTGSHRILRRSATAEKMFFSCEVFAPAKALVDVAQAQTVRPNRTYTMTHILCAAHEVILAEGVWVETMHATSATVQHLTSDKAQSVTDLLGDDLDDTHPARPCLTHKEAVALLTEEFRLAGTSPGEDYAKTA